MNVDLLVRRALVADGDNPPRPADVAVRDGLICAFADDLGYMEAAEVVDAPGLMLCPGFIDMHAHSGLEPFAQPALRPKVAQGFTTEVIGPDGLCPAPVAGDRQGDRRAYLGALEGPGPDRWEWEDFSEYLDALAATSPATTLVPSVGHGAVRDFVMGSGNRAPDAAELARMREVVRDGFEAGARALSFGMIYLPGLYAATGELEALAEEAAAFGAPLVPHVRNEADRLLESIEEFVGIARRTGAPLHLSHLKLVGNAHLLEGLLELVDAASRDVDLTFDQYPYGAGSTVLTALLPAWALEGGAARVMERITSPVTRRRIVRDVEEGLPGWENLYAACGPERIVIAHTGPSGDGSAGKTLAELSGSGHPMEAALDLLVDTKLEAAMVDHYASEEVVRSIFRHPLGLVGSDGIFGTWPHPRLYGTAARVLGRYSLRENLISVTDAVARLTARAADRLYLADRGRIREGLRADLVLIDPAELIDTATYDEPCCTPPGVRRVLVAGRAVWREGAVTGELPGGVARAALSYT
jgi:N-acyl-D-amino-acid deacylase